jgi:hypothetical protein
VFHVELRRFPHVARAFNLTEEELQVQIVLPWVKGAAVKLQDRTWTPDRARLTIYEAAELAAEDRGLGRGWSTVTRDGVDVTSRMLEAARKLVPQTTGIKRALLAAAGPVPLSEVVSLAAPAGRPSERLAVAEQAVWELLHEGAVTLARPGSREPVPPEQWEELLLRWDSWASAGASVVPGPTSER